jgi:hypothetical protein
VSQEEFFYCVILEQNINHHRSCSCDKIIPKNNDEGRAIHGNLEIRLIRFTGQWKIPFLKITIEADCSNV